MSVIVFRLNDVPEDEAQAIRELLAENGFDYYETSAGKWGFSVAAIWLKNAEDKDRARALIEEYEQQRGLHMREYHNRLRNAGKLESIFTRLVNNPLQVVVYLLLVLLVIYLTVFPFLSL